MENEPKKNVSTDKITVRFIHLSVNAGNLRIRQLTADGSEKNSDLIQHIYFGNASAYIQLDAAAEDVSDGMLAFHVYTEGSNNPLSVGVPATRLGSVYDLLLHGFTQPHTRRIFDAINTEGTVSYRTVELPAGFTATVRQMY